MVKISDAEFQRQLERFEKLALTEPVVVTKDGRAQTVLISWEEYQRLKRHERRVMRLEDFTAADLEAIEKSAAPDWTREFNHEMGA